MEGYRYLQHHPYFSIWALKFMLDGRIESIEMEEPYGREEFCGCGSPNEYRGRLLWDAETMVAALELVLRMRLVTELCESSYMCIKRL